LEARAAARAAAAAAAQNTTSVVATDSEATDASASEPAVVESAGAAAATTLVDRFASPPAAPLTVPQSAEEQVFVDPPTDQTCVLTSEPEGGAVRSPMAVPSAFVRRWKSVVWLLLLATAVVLCWIAKVAPETTFYGTLFLLTQVAWLVDIDG
jgi:hypothetical protein